MVSFGLGFFGRGFLELEAGVILAVDRPQDRRDCYARRAQRLGYSVLVAGM
jgi:hypothetical protein